MWTTRVFDTATGNPILTIDAGVSAATWNRRKGGTGSGTHAIKLPGLGLTAAQARDVFADQKRTIAVCWGNYVAYAGIIQDAKYKRNTRELVVSHDELRTFWRARMQFGVAAAPGGDLVITGRSWSGAVRAIIARAMQWSFEWTLAVDLPADGAGGFTATREWWRFFTIDDLLKEIEDQGVEIDHPPYLDGNGKLRWATLVGQPIVGATTDLPVTVADSRVVDFETDTDAARRVTGVIVAGQGSEADTMIAWAGNGSGSNPIPIRDVYRAQKDIEDQARLQTIANSIYVDSKDAVEQWSFAIQLADDLSPELVSVGRVLKMDVRGDDWVPDGMYTRRVIALKGGLDLQVTPEVQGYGA